jgi:glutamyl-tRNA reductase
LGVVDTLRKAASADMEETGAIVEKIERLVDEETCKAVSKSILESERFMNIYKNFLNDTCDLVKRELENQEVSPDKKGMH